MGRREGPLRAAVDALSKEGIQAYAVTGDVRDVEAAKKAIGAAVQRFGRLDILVRTSFCVLHPPPYYAFSDRSTMPPATFCARPRI